MKVYTHYYKLNSNKGLRWRTLLQFGESFDIIGSVVMKNPGSSKPIDSRVIDNENILSNLREFDTTNDSWYEFKPDDTMRKVAVLFASYYGFGSVNQLNGVVQIFNLFYIMEPNIEIAKQKMEDAGLPSNFQTPEDLLRYDIKQLVPPVYLGFGKLALDTSFQNSARLYFNAVMNSSFPTDYLDNTFSKNKFYHPRYLCGYGLNNKTSIRIRGKFKFHPMTDEQIQEGVPLPRLKMSK